MRCPTLKELPPTLGKTGWPWTEESPQLSDTMPDGKPWPRISIVTPSYNQGRFIEETIRSVLFQGYPNLEYIIIDGGSKDETLKILKKYTKEVKWVSEPDNGQSDALNKGFKMAKGEIIGWLNADDTYTPDAVKTAVDFFSTHPDIEMVYGQCNFINERGGETGEWIDKLDFDYYLLADKVLNFIPQPAVFFRRRVFDKVGFIDANLRMAMDYDFWLRIGKKCKVAYIPKILANFRIHKNAKSSKWFDFWPEILGIVIKYRGLKHLYWYFSHYYKTAKSYGYIPLDAYTMLEKSIVKRNDLHSYIPIIKKKGLSFAFMEDAYNDYLSNKKCDGFKNLLWASRIDNSLLFHKEYFRLCVKLILGYKIINNLKKTVKNAQH